MNCQSFALLVIHFADDMMAIIFKSHLEELQTVSVLMPGLEESINFVKTRLFLGSTYSRLVRGGTKKLVSQHENYKNLTRSKTQS